MIPMRVPTASPYLSPPDNQRDAFAARDLGMVAAGHDMRFGPMSPQSMFRGPTVRSAPGQYDVHPMMPSRGGPMPMPFANLGTSQYDRNMGSMGWAAQHQSPSEGSIASVLGMRPGGDMAVRLQGFPKQPGNPNGPGYAYAPAGQIAGAYNKLAGQNPGLNLGQFAVGADGQVTNGPGGAPMQAADLHAAMVQARRQRGQQNIEELRSNMRQRLAVRAAQRGNFGPLTSLMKQQQGAQGGVDDGVNHEAVFGLVNDMLKQGGDKLSVKQKSQLFQGLANAMLAGRKGASQIPALLGGLGDSIAGVQRNDKAKANDVSQPLDQDQLAQYRDQFKTPQDFAAFAHSSGMNDQVRNKWLYHLYGPDADFGNDGFAGGWLPHKLKIDPNQNYQSVPSGIMPGIGNWLYNSMFSRQAMGQPGNLARPFAQMFGMTAPPPVVGPAPRGSQPADAMPQQQLLPQRQQSQPLAPGRPLKSAYGTPPGTSPPAGMPSSRQASQGIPAAQQSGVAQELNAVTSLDSNSVMSMLGKRPSSLEDPRHDAAVQRQMNSPIGRLHEALLGTTLSQADRTRLRKWAEEMSKKIPPDHDAHYYLDKFKNNGILDTFDF